MKRRKIALCSVDLIVFLASLVIPYNPSSHESLDHVGEEKEVKYLNYADCIQRSSTLSLFILLS